MKFEISQDLLTRIAEYLSRRPWAEVNEILFKLNQEINKSGPQAEETLGRETESQDQS